MRVLIFGATGMVGRGVLRECLLDPAISEVRTIGRSATGVKDAKLRELVRQDLLHYGDIETELRGLDACFFCLGVSSGGMAEAEYGRLTYGITLAAAETLARLNPGMTFVYVSGAGTDSTEQGRIMWARVKGRTENALMRLPFKAAYMFRPAGIEAMHGEQSKVQAYRIGYQLMKPLLPLLRRIFPAYILTTEEIGRAMIQIAKSGASKNVLESRDIREYARAANAEQ
jgi:Predicted nucleoside-diphosphate-sugar epimerases